MALLRESGATLEQSKAAIEAVGAILPVAEFSSRNFRRVHLRP